MKLVCRIPKDNPTLKGFAHNLELTPNGYKWLGGSINNYGAFNDGDIVLVEDKDYKVINATKPIIFWKLKTPFRAIVNGKRLVLNYISNNMPVWKKYTDSTSANIDGETPKISMFSAIDATIPSSVKTETNTPMETKSSTQTNEIKSNTESKSRILIFTGVGAVGGLLVAKITKCCPMLGVLLGAFGGFVIGSTTAKPDAGSTDKDKSVSSTKESPENVVNRMSVLIEKEKGEKLSDDEKSKMLVCYADLSDMQKLAVIEMLGMMEKITDTITGKDEKSLMKKMGEMVMAFQKLGEKYGMEVMGAVKEAMEKHKCHDLYSTKPEKEHKKDRFEREENKINQKK